MRGRRPLGGGFLADSRVIRVTTGEVESEDDDTAQSYRLTMVNDAGAWKLEERFNEGQPCTPG
ncbi:MAG: hypothetical protein ACRD0U_04515 [Acidimicrobiales bacterium]